MAADEPLVKETFIEASPELVFSYLVQPEKMLRWMGLTVEMDPKPGGIFRLDPNGREMIRGEYLEVIPPRRIVFTWGWERGGVGVAAGSTVVEIDLVRQGSGTLLRLVHRRLPPDEKIRTNHENGWAHHLGRLKIAAEGGDPGPDPCWTEEGSGIGTASAWTAEEER